MPTMSSFSEEKEVNRTMDPNETLRYLRADIARLKGVLDPPGFLTEGQKDMVLTTADEVWQRFDVLDQWLTGGGFLPNEWAR